MGYDFDERLSQNEIRELGDLRLELSIAGRDSSVADQFYTIDPEREPIQFDRGETLSAEHVARRLDLQSSKAVEKKVVIVESRIFLRECIQRSIQSALSIPVETLTSFSELDEQRTIESARLVIISLGETNTQESAEALSIISDLAPSLPTIVLSSKYDFEVMRAVIGCGAKGYIPMTMDLKSRSKRFALCWRAGHTSRRNASSPRSCLPARRRAPRRPAPSPDANSPLSARSIKASRTRSSGGGPRRGDQRISSATAGSPARTKIALWRGCGGCAAI